MADLKDRPRWNDIFVKRPVIAIVVSLFLLLAGIRSAVDIPVLQFPVIQSSSIQIITPYPGATAESVQGFVTEPIERVANAIPGVDYVESVTTSGESIVTAWMQLNEDSTDALAELSSGLSQIRLELPDGAEDPFIEVSRADSPYASFYLAVSVPKTRSLGEVTDIVQRDIVPQLTSVPNVQRVENSGVKPAMRIWLNAWKMAALGVTAHDVRDTLQSNNVIGALGASESATQRITLKTDATARTADDFRSMIIRAQEGAEIRLGDVARIELGMEDMQMRSRYAQDLVVFLPIYAAPGASEIAVADALYDRIEDINKVLPEDLELIMAFDISNYMRDSLREIVMTLGETILLVGFVVVALMGSFRTALVPLMTIPISLLGAVAAMSVIGFSFNLLTVLAYRPVGGSGGRRRHCGGGERRSKFEGRYESISSGPNQFEKATRTYCCHDSNACGGLRTHWFLIRPFWCAFSRVRIRASGRGSHLWLRRHDPVACPECVGLS
jgi:multidrug efflux pump